MTTNPNPQVLVHFQTPLFFFFFYDKPKSASSSPLPNPSFFLFSFSFFNYCKSAMELNCTKHIKGSRQHYLLGQKHNLQIFEVILFIKLLQKNAL